MKPPWRLRLVPSRFAEAQRSPERPQRDSWRVREKRALLAALRAQAKRGLPEQLLPAALRERLPRRSEEEIRALLARLRGRAAREALTSRFQNFLRFQRRVRAPIQVWQDLAQTLGETLEGPPRAAFSHVLTVAAAEPLTLSRSGPPRNPGVLGPPGAGGDSRDPSAFGVDFGKVYEFLARISAGREGPPPGPAESAVVLSLLGALPAELGALGALGSLQRHLRGVWGSLSAPQAPGGAPRDPPPSPGPPKSPWAGAGLCPLNPLLVPLGLLGRAG